MIKKIFNTIAVVLVLSAGCAKATPEAVTTVEQTPQIQTLTVMTHDSFAVSDEVVEAFEQENNAAVKFLKSGDTGTALNQAILSIDNPLADVFYGVDNTFISRALEEGIFEPYNSELLSKIPDKFKLPDETQQKHALPVDYGDVCLNYDKQYFQDAGLQPPGNLEDLTQPEYSGLLVVQNPATSSPGLSFLLATIGNFGEGGYLNYWRELVDNDVLVVNDWESAYYTEFSGSSGKGPRPIVVSYDSSPAFEVIYAEESLAQAPTAAVVSDNSCFRQVEYVGILKGTQNRDIAEKWVDFMLSPLFQEDMPLNMFVFPVNPDAALGEGFTQYLVLPETTANVHPQEIAENRERWISDWTEAVLR